MQAVNDNLCVWKYGERSLCVKVRNALKNHITMYNVFKKQTINNDIKKT